MSEVKIGTDVLKSAVAYVQGADALIEKQASFEDAVAAEGSAIIDSLASVDLIEDSCKQACVEQLKESPTYVFELLKRAAEAMKEPEVNGVGVDTTKSASEKPDANQAFVNALL